MCMSAMKKIFSWGERWNLPFQKMTDEFNALLNNKLSISKEAEVREHRQIAFVMLNSIYAGERVILLAVKTILLWRKLTFNIFLTRFFVNCEKDNSSYPCINRFLVPVRLLPFTIYPLTKDSIIIICTKHKRNFSFQVHAVLLQVLLHIFSLAAKGGRGSRP